MRTLIALLALAAPVLLAQDAGKKGDADTTAKKVEPLPKGKVKVFEAVVMEVEGTAQGRSAPEEKWKDLAVNDVLKPGAVVRTGRESHVALRVGPNASILVERQSRVALPEIVQDGDVLRTRVKMSFGKADVRVDRVGLDNDFEVATPTATLAVRGTTFRVTWDAVSGFSAKGVPGNRLRAIEVRYLEGAEAALSGADSTSTLYALPPIDAFYETYVLPLKGAVGESELDDPAHAAPEYLKDPVEQTQLEAERQAAVSRGSGQG